MDVAGMAVVKEIAVAVPVPGVGVVNGSGE